MNGQEDKVVYMTNPEANYVSLVKRGANRTPFRIVKMQKEKGMKVIQRIVAKKGTDVEAIKSAVGDEAAAALQLQSPQEAGAFTVYEQHPESAFKSDELEVVSLSEDNAILALCGEMAEKSDGFSISKLLTKKSQTKVVEVPDMLEAVNQDVLKSDLSDVLWRECDALSAAVHGILAQASGETGKKVDMVKTIFNNFIASLETAASIAKSDDFVLPEKKQETEIPDQPEQTEKSEKACEDKKSGEEKECKEKKKDKAEGEEDSKACDNKKKEEQKQEDAVKAEIGEIRQDALIEKTAGEVLGKIQPSLDKMAEQLASLGQTIEKMQKAPAGKVYSLEENGPDLQVNKSQKSVQNVFAGCFGDLRR